MVEKRLEKQIMGSNQIRHQENLRLFNGPYHGVYYDNGRPRARKKPAPIIDVKPRIEEFTPKLREETIFRGSTTVTLSGNIRW